MRKCARGRKSEKRGGAKRSNGGQNNTALAPSKKRGKSKRKGGAEMHGKHPIGRSGVIVTVTMAVGTPVLILGKEHVGLSMKKGKEVARATHGLGAVLQPARLLPWRPQGWPW